MHPAPYQRDTHSFILQGDYQGYGMKDRLFACTFVQLTLI